MTVVSNDDIVKEISDNVSEHDMLLRLSVEASRLASTCSAMAMQEPEGTYSSYSTKKAIENLNFRCSAVVSWMKALRCVDVNDATVYKFLKQWHDCTGLQDELQSVCKQYACKQYVTKHGTPIEVGKTYRGESDGKLWYVTAISDDKAPYTIKVIGQGETTTRDVKPEWLMSL